MRFSMASSPAMGRSPSRRKAAKRDKPTSDTRRIFRTQSKRTAFDNMEATDEEQHVRDAWDQAWSGRIYEDAIALITSLSGQYEIAVELGQITASTRVLDVGCGPGLLSESLAEDAASVDGIDFLESMIVQAKSRRSRARFQTADAECMPFEDRCFDVAICCYTAHHFMRPTGVFNELYRVLQPGGRVVVLHPIQSETTTFNTIYKALGEVLGANTIARLPSLEGPLYAVDTAEPYQDVLSKCGYQNIVVEKRIKPCVMPTMELLLGLTVKIGGLEDALASERMALTRALTKAAEPFLQNDGSYLFPDQLLVVTGEKR